MPDENLIRQDFSPPDILKTDDYDRIWALMSSTWNSSYNPRHEKSL